MPKYEDTTATTEDGIIESIDGADLEDESTEEVVDNAASEEVDATPEVTDTSEEAATVETTATDSTSTQTIQPGQFGYDAQGNVINHEGTVLAKSGAERRLFEKTQQQLYANRQTTQQLSTLQQENTQLREQLQQIPQLNGLPAQLGLNSQDAALGLQLMASFRRDPIATIQNILTEAKAQGHNIEGIDGARIDATAIGQMIDNKLAPLQQDREQIKAQQEAEQRAVAEYNAFVNNPEFQHARVHEDTLARLMSHDPTLTPAAAYYKLQSWVLSNGLDYSKPLAPQIQSAQNNQSTLQTAAPTAPLPGGGGGGVASAATTETGVYADPDVSYSDIVRQSMAEAGIS